MIPSHIDSFIQYYSLFKTIHLFFIIAWMVGLFYLPRLFVYHVQQDLSPHTSQVLKTMEKKLLNIIMTPALIFMLISGILLIISLHPVIYEKWLHFKLLFVFLLICFHMFLIYCKRQFDEGKKPFSIRFFRIINEIPTVLLLLIILFVVYKPL